MQQITVSVARKNIKQLLDRAKYRGETFIIGRHKNPEAILMKYPGAYNSNFSDVTNANTNSASFDFLADEPDLYDLNDLTVRYD